MREPAPETAPPLMIWLAGLASILVAAWMAGVGP